MSDERTPMAQQTVMLQALQDMITALWQLQLQADDVREIGSDEERKQREREEALAAQREREDQDRVERRERGPGGSRETSLSRVGRRM